MKLGFWNREDQLLNNHIFKNTNDPTGGSGLKKYNDLYNYCNTHGKKISLNTLDLIDDINQVDILIFIGFPSKNSKFGHKYLHSEKPKILINEECKYIEPAGWDIKNQKIFDIILTFDDDYIDNKKYKKVQLPVLEKHSILKKDFNNKKLACFVCANKKFVKENSLWQERFKIIKWFESNSKDKFDLYGKGWNELAIPWNWFLLNRLNYPRFSPIRRFFQFSKIKCWKGYCENRLETMSNYKFVFAFENFKNINGYITSKIFDAFYSKTVPIYIGAKNIRKHIPENCYIDYASYENIGELFKKINNFHEDEYNLMLRNIDDFIKSSKAYTFQSSYFTDTLINSCKSLLNKSNN